jgi:hypothetical protein
MLRVAVIYNDKDIYVEWTPERFKELLEEYTKQHKSVSAALDQIVNDIKRDTRKI